MIKNLAKADEVKKDIEDLNNGQKKINEVLNTKVAMNVDLKLLNATLLQNMENNYMPNDVCNAVFSTQDQKVVDLNAALDETNKNL